MSGRVPAVSVLLKCSVRPGHDLLLSMDKALSVKVNAESVSFGNSVEAATAVYAEFLSEPSVFKGGV